MRVGVVGRVDVRRRDDARRATRCRGRGSRPPRCGAWNSSRNFVDVARDRDRVGVAERAEALAVDALADVERAGRGRRAMPAPVLDLLQDLRQPPRPDAARRALAARLVLVELRDADAELHHAAAVVDRDHRGRADRGPGLPSSESKSSVTRSTSSAVRIAVEEPPGMTAFSVRPSAIPPPTS